MLLNFYTFKKQNTYSFMKLQILIISFLCLCFQLSAQTTTTVNPDGTHSTTYRNGNSSTTVNPNGTHSTTFHNGNTSTTVNPDGTHSTTYHSGNTSTTVSPDGTHTTYAHNGNNTNAPVNTNPSSSIDLQSVKRSENDRLNDIKKSRPNIYKKKRAKIKKLDKEILEEKGKKSKSKEKKKEKNKN